MPTIPVQSYDAYTREEYLQYLNAEVTLDGKLEPTPRHAGIDDLMIIKGELIRYCFPLFTSESISRSREPKQKEYRSIKLKFTTNSYDVEPDGRVIKDDSLRYIMSNIGKLGSRLDLLINQGISIGNIFIANELVNLTTIRSHTIKLFVPGTEPKSRGHSDHPLHTSNFSVYHSPYLPKYILDLQLDTDGKYMHTHEFNASLETYVPVSNTPPIITTTPGNPKNHQELINVSVIIDAKGLITFEAYVTDYYSRWIL